MFSILQLLQNFVYSVREYLWLFPQTIFVGTDSPYRHVKELYLDSRPFSHFFVFILAAVVVVPIMVTNASAFLRVNTSTYIEGVIVGVDANGQLRQLNRISPLIVSDIQLEKDLNELIYESLIKIDQKGEVTKILASDYEVLDNGSKYKFTLNKGIYWHDGVELTSNDVAETFALLQQLEQSPETSSISSRAAVNMNIEVIDDYNFEFVLEEGTVIPGFFEAIGFKILPAHLMTDLTARNINTPDPILNRNPIGTGPFRLQEVESNSIILRRNQRYREDVNLIILKFNLYPNEVSAVNAIKSGQIHGLAGVSIDNLHDLRNNPSSEILTSDVIYNQYWALYFNLQEDMFKDKRLRQAIASGINKDLVVEALLGYVAPANSSIPSSSFAYADIDRFVYDKTKAEELLTETGWELPAGKVYREKDGKQLEFEMFYVDNVDRAKIASVIRDDLAEIGINLIVTPISLAEMRDQHIIPKQFSTILFGVQTFIDPDRYELFHSSQIDHPGLNISSYASEREVLAVVPDPERPGKVETKKIPEVDDLLDDARKIIDHETRKSRYTLFQEIIAEDVPVVFLYHPKEIYTINRRVKNVKIGKINSIEERFNQVAEWEISL